MENGNMARRDCRLYLSGGNISVGLSEMQGRSRRQKRNFEKNEQGGENQKVSLSGDRVENQPNFIQH